MFQVRLEGQNLQVLAHFHLGQVLVSGLHLGYLLLVAGLLGLHRRKFLGQGITFSFQVAGIAGSFLICKNTVQFYGKAE